MGGLRWLILNLAGTPLGVCQIVPLLHAANPSRGSTVISCSASLRRHPHQPNLPEDSHIGWYPFGGQVKQFLGRAHAIAPQPQARINLLEDLRLLYLSKVMGLVSVAAPAATL